MTDKQFIKRVLARLKAYERNGNPDELSDLFPLRDQYLAAQSEKQGGSGK